MMRSLNILAIATLIGSATAAYSVKYETILVAEKLKKREIELQREKDAIAILKAEWQMLNRPARLQNLAPPAPGMQPLSVRQILRASEVPARSPEKDPLAAALDGSLTGSIAPSRGQKAAASTPTGGTPRPVAARATPAPRPGGTTPLARSAPQAAPRSASGAPLALQPPPAASRNAGARAEPPAPVARGTLSASSR